MGFLDFELVDKAFGAQPQLLAKLLFWFSVALLLAPVLVVAAFYFCWRPIKAGRVRDGWKFPFKNDFWTKHRAEHADESILSLLTNESTERAENKTKISPDPTAIEFRSVFNDLLKALSAQGHQLVIVIDNLDRLAEQEAMQLWATIRSLFLGNNRAFEGVTGLKPPTIILPIDEAAIVRMFASTHDAEGEAERLAESFNEKTFDIAFHVNEPVMSDWRAYLRDKLNQAFGDFVNEECSYWITKIVEDASAQKAIDGKITPRKIIKLINSIGALLSQWGRAPINILTMAFYVAHRSAITLDVPAFLKEQRPRMDAAVQDWRRELVALHFGVNPDKAYQTLLAEPLTVAIGNLNSEDFASLIEVPGAPEVIEELFENLQSDDGPESVDANFIANATILIGESAKGTEIWARRSLEGLTDRWTAAPPTISWRTDFPALMKRFSPAKGRASAFFIATGEKLGAAISTQESDDEIALAFAGAVVAVRDAAGARQNAMPKIPVSLAPSDLFGMLGKMMPEDRPAIRSDKTTKDMIAEFDRMLAEEARSGNLPSKVRMAASKQSILYKDTQKFDWETLAQSAFANITSNDLTHFATGPSLDILGLLYARHANVKALLDTTFDSGRLAVLLNEADSSGNVGQLADIAALMFLRGTDFAAPNGQTWDDVPRKHLEFIRQFKKSLHWYAWENATKYVLSEQKGRGSFMPIVHLTVKDEVEDNASTGVPTEHILTNLEAVESYLGPELISKSISDISVRPGFWAALEGMKIGGTFNRVVVELIKSAAIDKEMLAAAIRVKLDATDLPGWREAIQEEIEPIELAGIYRSDLGKTDALGDDLKAALHEQLSSLVNASPKTRRAWFTLSAYVSKSARATLYKSLRDSLLAGTLPDADKLADLLLAGGHSFMIEGKFPEEPDKSARHIVLPLAGSEDGWSIIEEQPDFYAAIVAKSENESQVAIRESLSAEAETDVEAEARARILKRLFPGKP